MPFDFSAIYWYNFIKIITLVVNENNMYSCRCLQVRQNKQGILNVMINAGTVSMDGNEKMSFCLSPLLRYEKLSSSSYFL